MSTKPALSHYDEVEDLVFEIELFLATCELLRAQGGGRKANPIRKANSAHSTLAAPRFTSGGGKQRTPQSHQQRKAV